MRVQTLAVLLTGLVIALAAPATAAPKKAITPSAEAAAHRARVHFDKGMRLYKQARYKDAISQFEAAYKDRPHGVIFFNIAQSYEKLGEIGQALKAYHQYLRALPDAEDRATVGMAMKNLEQRLAATGVQQLLVYSNPDAARVLVDGKPAGLTPYSGEYGLGAHTVAVEIEGYALTQRKIELTASASVVLDVTLEQVTQTVPLVQAPDTPPVPALTVSPAAVPTSEGVQSAPPPPPEPEAGPRVWTWVAGGVGVAALATAVALGASAKSTERELHGSMHDRPTATRLAQSAQGSAQTSNIFFGVAGAAGAATVALFFVEGRF